MGRTVKRSKTSSFGTVTREGHDSRAFYDQPLYKGLRDADKEPTTNYQENIPDRLDIIHCADSRDMHHLPDNSVHLMITSPPYSATKEYDADLSLTEYLDMLAHVLEGDLPYSGEGRTRVCQHRQRRADSLHTVPRLPDGHRP